MARRKHDFYETPPHYVAQIGDYIDAIDQSSGWTFEPCVGNAAIAQFLHPRRLDTNDINPNCNARYHRDATDPLFWDSMAPAPSGWEWTITNPPFNVAFPIVCNAVEYSRNVAMLLRISFFEPTRERERWLVAHPPARLIYLPRYSFTGKGSDSATCCWALWGPDVEPGVEIAPRFPSV